MIGLMFKVMEKLMFCSQILRVGMLIINVYMIVMFSISLIKYNLMIKANLMLS